MRRAHYSLTRATREAGTTIETAIRYIEPALIHQRNGRYAPKPWDRLIRPMKFLTRDGLDTLNVKDSRSASRIAQHMAAVHDYLKTSNSRALRPYLGKSVRVDGFVHSFITDGAMLERLAAAGEVTFEEMYTITRE
jgi:hypothetical protein